MGMETKKAPPAADPAKDAKDAKTEEGGTKKNAMLKGAEGFEEQEKKLAPAAEKKDAKKPG